MDRRIFLCAAMTAPSVLVGKDVITGWKQTGAPVEEWVWIICGGDRVELGWLCSDGIWVGSNNYVIHSVTHWMELSPPKRPSIKNGYGVYKGNEQVGYLPAKNKKEALEKAKKDFGSEAFVISREIC